MDEYSRKQYKKLERGQKREQGKRRRKKEKEERRRTGIADAVALFPKRGKLDKPAPENVTVPAML